MRPVRRRDRQNRDVLKNLFRRKDNAALVNPQENYMVDDLGRPIVNLLPEAEVGGTPTQYEEADLAASVLRGGALAGREALGMVPIVGEALDVAELSQIARTGKDFYGDEADPTMYAGMTAAGMLVPNIVERPLKALGRGAKRFFKFGKKEKGEFDYFAEGLNDFGSRQRTDVTKKNVSSSKAPERTEVTIKEVPSSKIPKRIPEDYKARIDALGPGERRTFKDVYNTDLVGQAKIDMRLHDAAMKNPHWTFAQKMFLMDDKKLKQKFIDIIEAGGASRKEIQDVIDGLVADQDIHKDYMTRLGKSSRLTESDKKRVARNAGTFHWHNNWVNVYDGWIDELKRLRDNS